jgi:Icc-related predicted phosphoesterase
VREPLIRLAAVGDLHVDETNARAWRAALGRCSEDADLLLLAGDLTQMGSEREARALATALADVRIGIVAVLGNHDHERGAMKEIAAILGAAGVCVLEGEGRVLQANGSRVGVAGVKGFGGGFEGASGSEFGEAVMKQFMATTREAADRLRQALLGLVADFRVALLHYAPILQTLQGEAPALAPFLGSHLLGDAIDAAGADLVLHGHAHSGREDGTTARGIPVRNVAHPVIRRGYRVYELPGAAARECRAPSLPIQEIGR